MRPLILATMLTLPVALGLARVAGAQTAPDHVFTPAPVPALDDGRVSPADRAGRPDGSERASPFSGLPDTVQPGSGQPTPTTTGDASRDGSNPSPALGK